MKDFFISAKLFAIKFYHQVKASELSVVARSLAFSTLLSLIPFITLIVIFYQSLGGFEALYPKIEIIFTEYMKDAAGKEASRALRKILERVSNASLGTPSLIFLFLSSFKLLQDLEFAVHKAWSEKNTRTIIQRVFMNGLMFIAIPLSLAGYATLSSISIIRNSKKDFHLDFLELTVFFLAILAINKIIPSKEVRWKPAILFSALTAVSLLFIQNSFNWAVIKVFNYSKLYGSLASVPLFMLWMYIFWMVILMGVALCASHHKFQIFEDPSLNEKSSADRN